MASLVTPAKEKLRSLLLRQMSCYLLLSLSEHNPTRYLFVKFSNSPRKKNRIGTVIKVRVYQFAKRIYRMANYFTITRLR